MNQSLKSKPIISVVVPIFNEAKNISELLTQLTPILEETDCEFEVLLVDDGSKDDSWKCLVEAAGADQRLRAFRFSRNFGKEAAMRFGLEKSVGSAVIIMDADLQHPPQMLLEMLEIWDNGKIKIVEVAKRNRGHEGLLYKFGAHLFYALNTRLSGFELRGSMDFKLLDRIAVNELLSLSERTLFFRGMSAWIGFPRKKVFIDIPERETGSSGWSLGKLMRLFFEGIAAFSSAPLQIVTFAGVIFLVFAILLGAQTVYNYLTGTAITGFTTVILLQLIIGSAVLLGLGIVGLYVATIYNEVKNRPYCVVAESSENVQMEAE